MFIFVVFIAVIGLLLLCLYGVSIENKLTKDRSYKAVCDLSDIVSCTKTFRSPYSKLLGISNIYVGIAFYIGMIVGACFELRILLLIGSILALVGSVYLAYLQYYKIKTVCLLCTSIYIVNVLLFIGSYYGW